GDKGNAFSSGSGANKPIDRILRIIVRKLGSESGDLSGDWLHVGTGADYKILRCVFDGTARPQRASREEKGQFPQGDVRNGDSIAGPGSSNCGSCRAGEPIFVSNQPYQHVGVEKNHRKTSQSSSGTAGDTMSPTISTSPFMQPNTSSGCASAGTNLATGRPLLVMTTGSRVERTSSMIFKHRALNCPAGTVFMTAPNDYGHYSVTISSITANSQELAARSSLLQLLQLRRG